MGFAFPVWNMPTYIYCNLDQMLTKQCYIFMAKNVYFYFLFFSPDFEISVSDVFIGNADSSGGASPSSVLQDGN